MKNVYVLPTDKQSKLYYWEGKLRLGDLTTAPKNLGISNQNIYITSDEEIKIGDYYLCKLSMKPLKCTGDEYFNNVDEKKIILTTDQDLIKDGVQAIDDEFIEWFVKNPSCDFVRIGKGYFKNDYEQSLKIIIPKEEPKQETLEEAAEKYAEHQLKGISDKTSKFECINDFIAGAKWQQEKIYNEIKELYDNENITGFSKLAYAKCLDIIKKK